MRLVFMGTSRFAVPSLEALVEAGHEILLVVTQPDKPSGRGLQMHSSPVKQAAQRMGLPIFQPAKLRVEEAVERIRSLAPLDAICVAAFGQIVPKSILDIPRLGSINVHASLLPRYRGAAPIQHAIAAGEKKTGVTTMLMDPGLDTGDILLQEETDIGPEETSGELEERLAEIGARLLIKTLERLDAGEIKPIPQDHSQATLAPSIEREAGEIDWKGPAWAIVNKIRAFTPRPGAYTFFDGKMLKIWRARMADVLGSEGERGRKASPGLVIAIGSESIEVATGEGSVLLLEVQPEGKRRMTAGEFARGARLAAGTSFFAARDRDNGE